MHEPNQKHWLIQHAEQDPLGGLLTPLSGTLDRMFIGAVELLADGFIPPPPATVSTELRRLINNLNHAQEIVRARRIEALRVAEQAAEAPLSPTWVEACEEPQVL